MRALVLLLLAGCPPDPDDPCGGVGEPSLALGDGRGGAFTPVSDGDTVDVVWGAQGGFHLEVGVLARHLPGARPGRPTFYNGAALAWLADDPETQVADTTMYLRFTCDRDLEGQVSTGNVLQLWAESPEVYAGETLLIDLTLTSEDGEALTVSGDLTLAP